jgi:hypothetical protein
MTYQAKYQAAKEAGYSDEEIMEFLAKKDPTFEVKMDKAKEAGYSPEEVLGYFNAPKQEEEPTFGKYQPYADEVGKYASDIGKQGLQGFGIGALGTYGDILDLLGLQAKEILPGEKAKNEMQFDILEKMNQPGYKPSAGDFMALSEDDDILPRYSRLPNSGQVEHLGKELGLVSEAETAAGRYAKRIGKLGGGGASLGGGGILAPIIAGSAGQTLEEMGAPPWAQAAAEILATLRYAPRSTVPISGKTKEVENVIKDLRKAGYSEKDITLAKSALEERNILKKYATLTPKAENAIQQGVKNSEQLFKEQVKKGLPGYAEGGIPYLEKQASNLYGKMEELASSVPVKNTEPVRKSIQNAIDYLEKYPLLDEQKKFIEFMKDGLNKLQGDKTAEFLTGFYRNLGKAGNWGDPKQKEHLLGLVKQGIKDTFAESGPEAAQFGKIFEATNEGWKKWLNARDLMQTIEKAQNVDGMNFKKLAHILNDSKNHELAKKVLGPEQVENIKSITKGADAIESLLKQIPKTDKTSAAIKTLEAIRSLITGDFRTLGVITGLEFAKKLATKLLIDPKKQNTMKKLIVSAKNNASKQAMILAQELIEEDSLEENEDSSP